MPPWLPVVRDDHEIAIKAINKGSSAKLRHLPHTHRMELQSLNKVVTNDSIDLEYVEAAKQRAEIFTKKGVAPAKWDAAFGMLNLHRAGRTSLGGG